MYEMYYKVLVVPFNVLIAFRTTYSSSICTYVLLTYLYHT